MSQQGIFLAKALYDNIAETPDELAFRRGDVLTVLEQDTSGLEGWWLCTVRGKQGIAPGNRLKILSGMGESKAVATGGGMLDGSGAGQNESDVYDQPNRSLHDYDVPPVNRGHLSVGGPIRKLSYDSTSSGSRGVSLGDDLYDTPPSSKRGSADDGIGIYDTPPTSKRASSERTPPPSNRSSASRDSGSNLLSVNSPSQLSLHSQNSNSSLSLPGVVKRRSGSHSSENCYETPPGSNRSSLERILSEEGPPIYDTLSPAGSSEKLGQVADDATYDTPPVRNHVLSHASPTSQSSLRSLGSSESLLSTTSANSSAQLSHTTSLPNSARSSMDLPSDTYDVPPALKDNDRSRKQLSMDSGLGFYDSPVKARPSSSSPSPNTIMPSPEGMRTSQSSLDCKSNAYHINKDFKRSKSLEHALDDLYDTPKNNAPKISLKNAVGDTGFGSMNALNDPSGVYDIPPQVTRDSVISMRSDSSDENQRFSSSSMDSDRLSDTPMWDELYLDLDSALELLVKKQQEVSKATSRLSSFVNTTWRSRESLEKTMYDIKVSCSLVRSCLHEFVDFSQGAIANAIKLPDRQLANRLYRYVAPLQNTLELVNRSFANLEEIKWQVSTLSEPLNKSKQDDLGQIALVAKDLLPEVKKVASFIQSNSSSLFKKAPSSDGKKCNVSSKPPIGPKISDSAKGNGSFGYNKGKHMQHRPLPAVPGSEKIPSTSTTTIVQNAPKLSMYDIKAALHKDDYAECDDVLAQKESLAQAHKEIMEQCLQEYDYVQLDANDTLTKSSSKNGSKASLVSEETAGSSDRVKSKEIPLNEENDKKSAGRLAADLSSLDMVDSDMDMIPVKEASSGSTSERNASSQAGPETNGKEESINVEADLSEQDLKTPVNVNNSGTNEQAFILPNTDSANSSNDAQQLDPNDRQVLVFHIEQINSHSTLLANAIDAFITVVGSNQPPNVFISHSKFVIVSAHKLVHIGDSIHRNLISNSVSARIMQCANHLCDCLKASVTATKTAALQYPSVPAVQEMVDRVIAVSHAAHELKLVITQAAQQ